MKRIPLPTLDQADRRVVGIALIVILAFLLACLVVGGGVGLGVFAFRMLSGGM